jgi:hypothetical protein
MTWSCRRSADTVPVQPGEPQHEAVDTLLVAVPISLVHVDIRGTVAYLGTGRFDIIFRKSPTTSGFLSTGQSSTTARTSRWTGAQWEWCRAILGWRWSSTWCCRRRPNTSQIRLIGSRARSTSSAIGQHTKRVESWI